MSPVIGDRWLCVIDFPARHLICVSDPALSVHGDYGFFQSAKRKRSGSDGERKRSRNQEAILKSACEKV